MKYEFNGLKSPLWGGLFNPLFSPFEASAVSGSGGVSLPSGAIGVWYADQYDSSTKAIANSAASEPLSSNILRAPRRQFGQNYYWSRQNITVTEGVTNPLDSTTDAAQFVGTNNWAITPASTYTIPAGTYTFVATLWTNSGTATVGWAKNFGGGVTRENSTTVTTTPTRCTYTFTVAGATALNLIALCDITGATPATFNICDLELYAGSSDLGPQGADSNLYFGNSQRDTRPVVTAGVSVGFQSAGSGCLQMPTSLSLSAVTAVYVTRKVGAGGTGGYLPIISKMGTGWASFTIGNATPSPGMSYNSSTLRETASYAGHWQSTGAGWAVYVQRYSGTVADQFIGKVRLQSLTTTVAAPTGVKDFFAGSVQDPNTFYSGEELFAFALYERSLTDAEVLTAVAAMTSRATAKGLTLQQSRYSIGYGDSLMVGSAGTPSIALVGPNLTDGTHGMIYAVGGSSVSSLDAQFAKFDARLPADTSGMEIIEVFHIGTNDLAIAASNANTDTFLTTLAGKLDARRALGRKVVLFTLLARTDASASGFLTNRARANTEFRLWTTGGSIVSGIHCDGIVDWASDATIGTDTAPNDTTYFNADKVHPTTATYTIGETYLRTAMNAL